VSLNNSLLKSVASAAFPTSFPFVSNLFYLPPLRVVRSVALDMRHADVVIARDRSASRLILSSRRVRATSEKLDVDADVMLSPDSASYAKHRQGRRRALTSAFKFSCRRLIKE
jgi:hypothetical protein